MNDKAFFLLSSFTLLPTFANDGNALQKSNVYEAPSRSQALVPLKKEQDAPAFEKTNEARSEFKEIENLKIDVKEIKNQMQGIQKKLDAIEKSHYAPTPFPKSAFASRQMEEFPPQD